MLVLDITPVPAGRPRVSRFSTYYGKNHTKFKKDVKPLIEALNLKPLEGALSLRIIFYMKIPTSLSKKRRDALDGQWHTSRPDTDNLTKLIKDCLEGFAYNDDAQVCHEVVSKIYSFEPRIEFELNTLSS